MSFITVTFGDQAENHARMQMIGNAREHGFTTAELRAIAERVPGGEYHSLCVPGLAHLKLENAGILIVRELLRDEHDAMFEALKRLNWDKKAFMRGRVVEKRARWNVCFADEGQEPDYADKKGRIVAWRSIPCLDRLRQRLPSILGPKAAGLVGEGNYYYDAAKTGIGYHGDAERRIVVAARFGQPMSIYYQWHFGPDVIGPRMEFKLQPGDLYVMSEKAVGTDWMKRTIPTLRHAAGSAKYTGDDSPSPEEVREDLVSEAYSSLEHPTIEALKEAEEWLDSI